MRPKIVIISSHYLHAPVKEAMERLKLDCDLVLTTYDNFMHIPSVYDNYAEEADGFLVSGRMAKSAIDLADHKIQKPVVSFQIDLQGLYKSILDVLIDKNIHDFERIAMDFMVPFTMDCSASAFLKGMKSQDFAKNLNQWINNASAQEISHMEAKMTERIIQLYKSGQIDIVICQFTNILPALIEQGIPYLYPFPSDLTFTDLLHDLFVKIEMEKLRANRSTILRVSPRRSDAISQENLALLSECLKTFFKDNLIECMIQERDQGFYAFATVQVLESLTNHYTTCSLSGYLNEHLPFECAVGYGIGNTLNDALQNSYHAIREARFSGRSFIKNEHGDLIGPLGSENRMIIEHTSAKNVVQIARKCKLSTITIQKLISYQKLTGSNKVTTQELSARFGVTVRNANRIFQNLQEGGYAHLAYTQTSNSKGRPVKVYELDFK